MLKRTNRWSSIAVLLTACGAPSTVEDQVAGGATGGTAVEPLFVKDITDAHRTVTVSRTQYFASLTTRLEEAPASNLANFSGTNFTHLLGNSYGATTQYSYATKQVAGHLLVAHTYGARSCPDSTCTPVPFRVTMTFLDVEGHERRVTAQFPAFDTLPTSLKMAFYVAADGSTYYADPEHDGYAQSREIMPATAAIRPEHLAARAIAPQIVDGAGYYCALDPGGATECWGNLVPNLSAKTLLGLGGGTYHVCGILPDGLATCSGSADAWVPRWLINQPRYTSLGGGLWHHCGITTSSSIYCFGDPNLARLHRLPPGLVAQYGDRSILRQPPGTFSQLSSSTYHVCAVRSDSTVFCMGDNRYGQSDAPAERFKAIAAADTFTCGLLEQSGLPRCWGDLSQVGVPPPEERFDKIFAGPRHVCGARASGAVTCWGSFPNGVSDAPARSFDSVAIGWGDACGVTSAGDVECWGPSR